MDAAAADCCRGEKPVGTILWNGWKGRLTGTLKGGMERAGALVLADPGEQGVGRERGRSAVHTKATSLVFWNSSWHTHLLFHYCLALKGLLSAAGVWFGLPYLQVFASFCPVILLFKSSQHFALNAHVAFVLYVKAKVRWVTWEGLFRKRILTFPSPDHKCFCISAVCSGFLIYLEGGRVLLHTCVFVPFEVYSPPTWNWLRADNKTHAYEGQKQI